MRPVRVSLIILLATMIPIVAIADARPTQSGFDRWIGALWPDAKSKGISRTTFDQAMRGLTLDLTLDGLASEPQHQQREFRPPASYFRSVQIKRTISLGQEKANSHRDVLGQAEQRYNVPRHILLAIWARESGFGNATIDQNAFQVLATRAYVGPRKPFYRAELLAALNIVQNDLATVSAMKSAWGGALGQPQFMPSTFIRFARDGDGNKSRDIWGSASDTLMSIAAYLEHYGWDPAIDWGYEVSVGDNNLCILEGPDKRRSITDWQKLGVNRVAGRKFSPRQNQIEAFLVMPAGANGPAFLATANFLTLKAYNQSDLYALYVGHLADRMRLGSGTFVGRWGKTARISKQDIIALQRRLSANGYDVGGIDGLIGHKTRRAFGQWQLAQGKSVTCDPTLN